MPRNDWISHRGKGRAKNRPRGRIRISPARVSNLYDGMSLTELARILGVHPETIRQWVKDGLFGHQMPNGKWEFYASDVKEYLENTGRM